MSSVDNTSLIVDPSILPQGSQIWFKESTFFARHASLPTPSDVRVAAREQNPTEASIFERPPPVAFPSLGLIVKYGGEITIAEGQCLWAIRCRLRDRVPVPEIYGWDTDGGQVFLYMELVTGVTLEERYPSLSHEEKIAVSFQLRVIVRALRELRQDPKDPFVGHIWRQPLFDMLFTNTGCPTAGPFPFIPALLDFLADMANPPPKRCTRRPLGPFRYKLPDDGPITFTHNDLHRRNIIVRVPDDGAIRIMTFVDWHQSEWLPPFREWCKAYWCIPPQRDDWAEYLRDVLEPFENFDYWSHFGTCMGT